MIHAPPAMTTQALGENPEPRVGAGNTGDALEMADCVTLAEKVSETLQWQRVVDGDRVMAKRSGTAGATAGKCRGPRTRIAIHELALVYSPSSPYISRISPPAPGTLEQSGELCSKW